MGQEEMADFSVEVTDTSGSQILPHSLWKGQGPADVLTEFPTHINCILISVA